jgi:hypothetical protein
MRFICANCLRNNLIGGLLHHLVGPVFLKVPSPSYSFKGGSFRQISQFWYPILSNPIQSNPIQSYPILTLPKFTSPNLNLVCFRYLIIISTDILTDKMKFDEINISLFHWPRRTDILCLPKVDQFLPEFYFSVSGNPIRADPRPTYFLYFLTWPNFFFCFLSSLFSESWLSWASV